MENKTSLLSGLEQGWQQLSRAREAEAKRLTHKSAINPKVTFKSAFQRNGTLIPVTALWGRMHWFQWNGLKLWMLRVYCGCIINICGLAKLQDSVSHWASLRRTRSLEWLDSWPLYFKLTWRLRYWVDTQYAFRPFAKDFGDFFPWLAEVATRGTQLDSTYTKR